jgi:trimeric autotransporter adhesin
LSADTLSDDSDIALGEGYVYYLYPGLSSQNWAYITIPSYVTPGSYYIIAQADGYNEVTEVNEFNNTSLRSIQVVEPNVDLVIAPADSVFETFPYRYLPLAVSLTNKGLTQADPSIAGLYLSRDTILDSLDMNLTDIYFNGLQSQESTFSQPYIYINEAPGNYYLIYVADKYNSISETDESNNIYVRPFLIKTPHVDLVPGGFDYVPVLKVADQNYTTYQVNNIGSTPAYGALTQFYLSVDSVLDAGDLRVGNNFEDYIAPDSMTFNYTYIVMQPDVPSGNYYLIMRVDDQNSIPEINELNNIICRPVTIEGPSIDLAILNPVISSTTLQAGGFANISFEDHNQGTFFANYHSIGVYISTDTLFDFSDTYANSFYGSYLYPNQSNFFNSYVYIPTSLAAGHYYVLFVDDLYNEVRETNESNNTRYLNIDVTVPNVDLKVKTLHLSVSNLIAGSSLIATDSIHNKGTDVSLPTYTLYYLSTDTILDLDSVDVFLNIAYTPEVFGKTSVFNSVDLTIPSWVVGGTYYILFQADGYNQQSEKDETNNVAYKKLTVKTSTVDLTVKNHAISKAKLLKGETFTVSCNEANLGNTDASGSYLGYFLSTDNQYSYDDVILSYTYLDVPAKSTVFNTASVTIPANTPAGNYFILFGADAFQYVNETDETNNFVYKAITVKNGTLRIGADPEPDVNTFAASIYPNPVNEQINATVEGAAPGTQVIYTMVDIIGNKVKAGHSDLVNGGFSIPVSGLPAGIYILHIENAGNIKTLKVIKE